MLVIWLKFCPMFLYLPHEKTKNIGGKVLNERTRRDNFFKSINEQAEKSANTVELKSKLNINKDVCSLGTWE